MRNLLIATVYSDDKEYRYEIYDREDGSYQVWIQQKYRDEYMGNDWYDYFDINDYAHITDTVERAHEIGREALDNFPK